MPRTAFWTVRTETVCKHDSKHKVKISLFSNKGKDMDIRPSNPHPSLELLNGRHCGNVTYVMFLVCIKLENLLLFFFPFHGYVYIMFYYCVIRHLLYG